MDPGIVGIAAVILAALFLLIFLFGILASIFTPVMNLIDLILPALASLYYKIFRKNDDVEKKQGQEARTDYSIEQGEEIK